MTRTNCACDNCPNIGIDCVFCKENNEYVSDLSEEESKEIAELICKDHESLDG